MKCPNCEIELISENNVSKCTACGFHFRPNVKKIDSIYVWMSIDKNGLEGMMAAGIEGRAIILQSSNYETAIKLKPYAERAIQVMPDYKVKLIKFVRSE